MPNSHTAFPRFPFAFLFSSCAAALLASCSGSETPKPSEPVELRTTEAPSTDTPEAQLFNEAKRLYRAGLYTIAIDSFESLRVNYPLSPYVEFSEIKIADAKFETNDFPQAAAAYEEFVKNHPASSITPYALLQAGRSNQLSNRGVGRDMASLEKAREMYSRLIQQYPQSFYVSQARTYLQQVAQTIADNEQFVMDFYRRKGNPKAVEARAKVYEDKLRPAVLQIAADLKASEGAPAKTAPSKPENPNVLAALRAPAAASTKHSETLRDASHASEQNADFGTLSIQRVQCRAGKVFLFLREPYTTSVTEIRPNNGKVQLALNGLTARPTTQDCLATSDLSLSADATLTLASTKVWEVMSVDNPPRLMLVER